jgi:predicted phosphodiesterase
MPKVRPVKDEWRIERSDTHVHRLIVPYSRVKETRTVYAMSDLHWDSAHCEREILKSHLEAAKKENAMIIMAGDVFDLMQGKWDPRRDQSVLRPEHRGNCYLDSVLETAVEWFKPYAKTIALISPGNHETSVQARNDTDIIQRFADGLRPHGFRGAVGQYWGWVLFQSHINKTVLSRRIHYHHGYGGGGEVTRGLIDNSRTRGMYEGGDVYLSGHIHRRNADENNPIRVTSTGKLEMAQQFFLRCAAYKNEHKDGWHVSKGRAARPIGGWAIDFTYQVTKWPEQNRFLHVSTRML